MPVSGKSPSPEGEFKLVRHARFRTSDSTVGVKHDPASAQDDVLARLDALFQDIKAKQEEDYIRRYSYVDSSKCNEHKKGSIGERRGSLTDRRSSLSDRRGNVGERRGSVGDRRGNVGDRRGSVGDRLSGSLGDRRVSSSSSISDRRGSVNGIADRRGSLNGTAERRGSLNGTGERRGSLNGTGDRRGTLTSSLDRRSSTGGGSAADRRSSVNTASDRRVPLIGTADRRPSNSSNGTLPGARRGSTNGGTSSLDRRTSAPDRRSSLNGGLGNVTRTSPRRDLESPRRDVNSPRASPKRETTPATSSTARKPSASSASSGNATSDERKLSRDVAELRSDPVEALKKSGYRRDSLDVEALLGSRRLSLYDTSILEEDEELPTITRVTPPRFSPPRNSPPRNSPPRNSPSRSSPPRSSPSRASPARASPPRSSPSRASPSRGTSPMTALFRINSGMALTPAHGHNPLDVLFPSLNDNENVVQDSRTSKTGNKDGEAKPRFLAVTALEDVQAVRCAEFHPSGRFYAVGSNSKTLRICGYPKLSDLREDHATYQPTVLFKRTKHHKGSIYCLAWSPMGDLIATGSNDKTVKLMRFNADSCNVDGQEIELTMHDGTVRDMCFIEDTSNKSSLLISGGAGDCKIYVTDCATGTPFQALSGHTGHILALYTWGGAMFVSGSQDRTVRFWDLRTRGCVNVITPAATPTKPGAPVASVCVDPSGRLLVTGHEDSVCSLYDVRGSRCIQAFRPHSSDVRSIRFSPSAYYLLTAGYDNKLVLTDLQGDLTLPLPSVVVAEHQDKAISGRWHPSDFSFISTSADKMCTLWALPPV